MSALCEDRCDKLLQAASDRWEYCDLGNIDVIDIVRLVGLKHLIVRKRGLNITDLVFQVSRLHSTKLGKG